VAQSRQFLSPFSNSLSARTLSVVEPESSAVLRVLEQRVKVLSEGHIVVSVFGSGGTLGQALKEFKRIFNDLVQFGHSVVSGA
jgi:hypothetical protein